MMGEAEDNNNLAPNAVVKESRFNKFKNLFKKTNEKPQDLSAEPFNCPGETHVFIESEPLPQAKLLPIKKQEQAGSVAKTKKCLSWNSCCEVVKARKKVEEEARPPSPILPKVFFDSNGDFEKEFYQAPVIPEKKPKSHLIKVTKNIVIDTKKWKQHIKDGVKFAFSQIGLVGLVICYIILGAIIIMQIESSYEKENQEKIEHNRDQFFDNVRSTAEKLFNEYLRENFHIKYNQYRNEEMLLQTEMYREMFQDEEEISSLPKFVYSNELLRHRSLRDVSNFSQILDSNNTVYSDDDNNFIEATTSTTVATMATTTPSGIRTKALKYDQRSLRERMKERSSWYIELDKELFSRKIKEHLGILYQENEQMENKDQQSLMASENVWNYPNALLFCATVVTTIGYGNITPKSNIGKIFTIFYAIIGIPLMYMCWMKTGDLLAELFINFYSRLIRFLSRKFCKSKLKMPYSSTRFHENKEELMHEFAMEYDNPNDKHVPILATIGVLTAYIMAGAVIFSITEGWNILDGAYFCFITFTTIGFGDFVPGKRTFETKHGVIALCCIYLLLGMLITTMCIKLMQDEVIAKVKVIAQRLGLSSGIDYT